LGRVLWKFWSVRGYFTEGYEWLETALRLAQASGDRQGEWQTLLDLGLLWAERDYNRTGEYYRQALELARQSSDSGMLAHSLNRWANWSLNTGQAKESLEAHDEALRLFKTRQDEQGMAETLDLLGMSNMLYGDVVTGMRVYRDA